MLGDRAAVQPLIEVLKDPDSDVRREAARALMKIGEPREVYKTFVARPETELFNLLRKYFTYDAEGVRQLTESQDLHLKARGYYFLVLKSKGENNYQQQFEYSNKALSYIDPKVDTALAILSLWLKARAEMQLDKKQAAIKTASEAEALLDYLSRREKEDYQEFFVEDTLFLKGNAYANNDEKKAAVANYDSALEHLKTTKEKYYWLRKDDIGELESKLLKMHGAVGGELEDEYLKKGIELGEKYRPVEKEDMQVDEAAYARMIILEKGKGNYEEAQRLAEELSMRRTDYVNRKLDIKLADAEKQRSIDEYKIRKKDIEVLEEERRNLAMKATNKEIGLLATKEQGEAIGMSAETASEIDKIESEIGVKQRELSNYLVTLKRLHPDLAVLLGAKPIELKNAQERLSPHTALLQYLLLPDKLLTFIITSEDIHIHEEAIKKDDLKLKVEQYKAFLSKIDRSVEKSGRLPEDGTLEELDKIYSHLYEILIKPVEGKLRGITTLGISPNGYLHYVPFGALWTKEDGTKKYLIDKYRSVFYINSTSLFWIASDRTGKSDITAANLIAYINPDESLKYGKDEENELKSIFKKNDIYYGKAAKKETLQTMALSNTVLHFSTHGKLNNQNSTQSYLVMADNRNLTVQDIWGLPLTGNVVTTLSACETGLGQILSGDDIVSLENAFIYAGSPTVVSTLWKVDEKATAEIVKAFYKNLVANKMNKAEALTQAQRDLRKDTPSYKNPYFWAGFTLRGTYQ